MKFSAKACELDKVRSEATALYLFEGEALDGALKRLDKALNGHISKAVKSGLFEGKQGQTLLIDGLGIIPAGKILIAGLGKKENVTVEKVRQVSGRVAAILRDNGVKNFVTGLAQAKVKGADTALLAQAVTEGSMLALYVFDTLKAEKSRRKVDSATLAAESAIEERKMAGGVKKGAILADSACLARDMINLPSNIATPSYLAGQARKMSAEYGVKCSVFGPKEIEKNKMGGLMAVAKGSHQPARFIIMEWMKGPKNQKPIVLVGKGLTFDTGGISIKPSERMEEMKADMSGGAAVIAAMRSVAALKLKTNVVGLVPSTENMPGGSATKPGDVVTSLSGVSMEIINTDAEGRLILSDALAYAGKYEPDCVVDIATLTGACMVALGTHCSGLFGNDDDLMEQLKDSGEISGERLWPMPLWPEYEDQIKSEVADIKNVGPRWGGAITAAAFLKRHVKGKWAHLDVAGTAYISDKARSYIPLGGVGIGVRLFVDFIEKRAGL
ncbi:MAG: leucyl aminopeptidase [Nitrospinae bacterium]|nr:leucyl aminopeptidase [Nitrospinota bacterium]